VRFLDPAELRALVAANMPGFSLTSETRIPPHRNNVLLLMRNDA
jgi:hypothetical protein